MFFPRLSWFRIFISFIGIITIILPIAVLITIYIFSKELPDPTQLKQYNPAVSSRIYASDGQLLQEYAHEKRLFVPITALPKKLINAFIAAEDQNFYNHQGIDFLSIFRAAVTNLLNSGTEKPLVGGSTITQQVVKNFLLSDEKTLTRKIREAILAFRISKQFSKDRVLELYLNEIYLGHRSYGVASAALNYFNKSVGQLTTAEAAMLAALPKAPSKIDPHRFPDRAKKRRDWVIDRMLNEGFITEDEALLATEQPIALTPRKEISLVNAGFFTDVIRQKMIQLYDKKTLYEGGLSIQATLSPSMQHIAEQALLNGLRSYDRRHGWRGPIDHLDTTKTGWLEKFAPLTPPSALGQWHFAIVINVTDKAAEIGFQDGSTGQIPLEHMKWARKFLNRNALGPVINKATDVLSQGDIIAVSAVTKENSIFQLEQIPEVNGAIIALDPQTGRVLALVGGYYYGVSQFNRATQAMRQPGSVFKPFVYLRALEKGFLPSSIIVDEEIQLFQGKNLPLWKPQNHNKDFYGPITLRTALEKSRNTVTVRLAQLIGIDQIVEVGQRFGIIAEDAAPHLSLSLGATETTLLNMTTAYAMLANGGKEISPRFIERVQNSHGETIYRPDNYNCPHCRIDPDSDMAKHPLSSLPDDLVRFVPALADHRKNIVDPITAYQIVSMLEGVIQRGTASKARDLNRTLAGKTGTTDDSYDTWFIGFSSHLVAGVYIGFDNPSSLGRHEYGSTVALPVWKYFMEEALKNQPDTPFLRPKGIKLVKIDRHTGFPPSFSTEEKDIIYESFRAGTEPKLFHDNRYYNPQHYYPQEVYQDTMEDDANSYDTDPSVHQVVPGQIY